MMAVLWADCATGSADADGAAADGDGAAGDDVDAENTDDAVADDASERDATDDGANADGFHADQQWRRDFVEMVRLPVALLSVLLLVIHLTILLWSSFSGMLSMVMAATAAAAASMTSAISTTNALYWAVRRLAVPRTGAFVCASDHAADCAASLADCLTNRDGRDRCRRRRHRGRHCG